MLFFVVVVLFFLVCLLFNNINPESLFHLQMNHPKNLHAFCRREFSSYRCNSASTAHTDPVCLVQRHRKDGKGQRNDAAFIQHVTVNANVGAWNHDVMV